MRKIDLLLEEYGESHLNHTNKILHWFCIPLIVFSLMGLLASIPAGIINQFFPDFIKTYINWASVFLFFTFLYYLRLSITLAIGMLIFAVLCIMGNVWVRTVISLPLWESSMIIFAPAWIGQFFGHKIEGRKPSFLKDIQFLMIGPAWLMSFILKKLNISY